jgi:hypothetical protein
MKMEKIGQSYRLGIWAVSPEKADEFVEAWQSLSEWLAQHLPDERGAILLEDTTDTTRFISFSPVDNPTKVDEVMSEPECQDLMSKVMETCDTRKPHSMRVVGAVTVQPDTNGSGDNSST